MLEEYFDSIDFSLITDLLKYKAESPMIFSSGLFFILFIFFLFFYRLLQRTQTLRIIYVLLFSLFFYYKSSGLHVLLLVFAATSDFLIAQQIRRKPANHQWKKRWVFLSVFINLGILSYFKYFKFLGNLFFQCFEWIGFSDITPASWADFNILLPVGISFYTFQTMSYIVDVYRGDIKPIHRWTDYLFYVSFFPQLVAGPIVRAKDFIPQIYRRPYLSKEAMGRGLFLVMIGLFKKAVISDYISLNFVDRVFDKPMIYSGLENLMALYGYGMQIYCDFSGYSDMAIGLALFLGFEFNINFDVPFNAATITEFWRRWHISLSTWLKDYLYIPLGGNRKGKIRSYVNLFITMLLGGLWHGAGIRFLIWGALQGAALALHKLWLNLFPRMKAEGRKMKPFWKFLSILFTFHFITFTWLFFRCPSLKETSEMIHQITNNFHLELLGEFILGYRGVCFLILLGYTLHFMPKKYARKAQEKLTHMPFWGQALLCVLLLFVVFQMKSADVQPFIYFQF